MFPGSKFFCKHFNEQRKYFNIFISYDILRHNELGSFKEKLEGLTMEKVQKKTPRNSEKLSFLRGPPIKRNPRCSMLD